MSQVNSGPQGSLQHYKRIQRGMLLVSERDFNPNGSQTDVMRTSAFTVNKVDIDGGASRTHL